MGLRRPYLHKNTASMQQDEIFKRKLLCLLQLFFSQEPVGLLINYEHQNSGLLIF